MPAHLACTAAGPGGVRALAGARIRARLREVPEHQRHVDVPGPQHAQRLGRFGLGQPQVDAGLAPRSIAAAAGTMVPSADGNAASRSRPARSPV